MQPLVSIITPSYNSMKFISQTLESVINQTYTNWEMIIIDDHSTDGANEIIKSFSSKDSRIKLIELESNVGPAKARNVGIKKSRGHYISFLDSDDLWLPNKLEYQVDYMRKNKLPVTYSAYYTIDQNNKKLNIRKPPEYIDYNLMLKSNFIGNLTGIYNVELLGKVFFKEYSHEDYVLWLEIIKMTKFAHGITEPLAKYRVQSNSVSSNKFKAMRWQWNIYRNVERLSFIKSCYFFFFYIIFGITKRM